MISRSSDIFYRFGNDRILPKNVQLKQQVFEKTMSEIMPDTLS